MSRRISHIVFFGALWGIVEATLGYGLHLFRRIVPVPGLAGYVLFPIGFFLMLAAVRFAGRNSAALCVAAVAAGLKLASGFLPGVEWIFVINPSMAIIFEGLVVFLTLILFSFTRSPVDIFTALSAALSWRVLFLLANLLLPVQTGILEKGTAELMRFLFLESAVNGILIGTALWLGAGSSKTVRLGHRFSAPAWSLSFLFASAAFQLAFGYLG